MNPGFYLTRDSEFITQGIFGGNRDFDENFDKEWFDGTYVFKLDNNIITDLASDESEWVPGTWTMMLYEGESQLVIGQWLIVLEGGDVEVQFTAEKKSPTEWTMDFSNAKCPALESKYAE